LEDAFSHAHARAQVHETITTRVHTRKDTLKRTRTNTTNVEGNFRFTSRLHLTHVYEYNNICSLQEEALEELKDKYEQTEQSMEGKISELRHNIDDLRAKVTSEKEKAAYLCVLQRHVVFAFVCFVFVCFLLSFLYLLFRR
jgi:hypothetical protein